MLADARNRRSHFLSATGRMSLAAFARQFSAMAHGIPVVLHVRSEEHTSELQSLMRISYAVFCLKKKQKQVKMNVETILINRNKQAKLYDTTKNTHKIMLCLPNVTDQHNILYEFKYQ